MNNDTNSERVHIGFAGELVIYGPDDEEWYSVFTKKANGDDLALMQDVEPSSKPFVITDENIADWRRQAKQSYKEATEGNK